MGCNCNKKITTNVSTNIVNDLVNFVKCLIQYDMKTNGTAEVTDDEWKAFFYILNLFCLFKMIKIEKYKTEFYEIGGCSLCFDNVISAFLDCNLIEFNDKKTSVFLSAKKKN